MCVIQMHFKYKPFHNAHLFKNGFGILYIRLDTGVVPSLEFHKDEFRLITGTPSSTSS